MVSISVEDKTLQLYRGHFLWDKHSPVPSSFKAMGSGSSRRRSKGSRRASSYLPVVVLNNQQPHLESRSESKMQVKTQKQSTSWFGKHSRHDLTFGLLGSSSTPEPMRSSSTISGSWIFLRRMQLWRRTKHSAFPCCVCSSSLLPQPSHHYEYWEKEEKVF